MDDASQEGSVTYWLEQLADGDRDATGPIFARYFERLVAYARRRMSAMPRRVADEEDVALSAFQSFCRGAMEGRFPQLGGRDDLWRLLVTITARKARDQLVRQLAAKRGGGKVRGESVFDVPQSDDSPGIQNAAVDGQLPDLEVMVFENCQNLLTALGDETLAQVATLKLEGYTNEEIAEKLQCVPRTIERKLERIRQKWRRAIPVGDASGTEPGASNPP